MNNNLRVIYIIAGEASGDLLGAHLMRELKTISPSPLVFYGIGGEQMEKQGLKSLFPYHELSHIGFAELLPHLMKIIARIAQTVEDVKNKAPSALITIDSPGFCKRIVARLRKENFSTSYIHYVAPTVWAWRPERAVVFSKLFDHLLALLPFEPPYFEKAGLACSFVGHPLVAEIASGNAESFRKRYEIAENTPLFCLLPGSRSGEIKRHLPIFARSINLLAEIYPNLAIVVPIPKNLLEQVKPYFAACPFRAIITANAQDRIDGIAASKFAIVKSGTIALEVAKAEIPMIVAYRVNEVSAFIFRRLRLTKLVNLVNILLNKEVIPEILQEECTPLIIASAVSSIMQSKEAINRQINSTKQALKMMIPEQKSPSRIAAEIVLKNIE